MSNFVKPCPTIDRIINLDLLSDISHSSPIITYLHAYVNGKRTEIHFDSAHEAKAFLGSLVKVERAKVNEVTDT